MTGLGFSVWRIFWAVIHRQGTIPKQEHRIKEGKTWAMRRGVRFSFVCLLADDNNGQFHVVMATNASPADRNG